jgi:hypothetical protein
MYFWRLGCRLTLRVTLTLVIYMIFAGLLTVLFTFPLNLNWKIASRKHIKGLPLPIVPLPLQAIQCV